MPPLKGGTADEAAEKVLPKQEPKPKVEPTPEPKTALKAKSEPKAKSSKGEPKAPLKAQPKPPPKAPPKPVAKPSNKQPVIDDPHGMRPDLTNFDRRTAGTGGIKKISFRRDPDGRYAVKIQGELQEGLSAGKTKAPNYNRSGKFITNREAGLNSDWENTHLWGPGFGDEAAAGMMKAPKPVNQWYQNEGIEGWMRDLRKIAGPGAKVEVEATAIARDLEKSGWDPRHRWTSSSAPNTGSS